MATLRLALDVSAQVTIATRRPRRRGLGGKEAQVRMLSMAGALGALAILLSACGGSAASSDALAAQHEADLYHVTQIERDWHEATSTQDIELMMSLWAPDATFTVASGETLAGKDAIRAFWLKAPVFQPENLWVSETPAYKLRATVNGDKGTLYFECHYVDPETQMVVQVTAADQEVARINGEWLITNNVGAAPILEP